MNSNLTMQDIKHIQSLVDWIDQQAQEYCRDASPSKAGDLGVAVSNTKEFLNGYAAALRHFEKKEDGHE